MRTATVGETCTTRRTPCTVPRSTSAPVERGTCARLTDAIWAYNQPGWYVDDVLVLALRYGSDDAGAASTAPAADVAALIAHPNVVLSPEARGDLLAGIVDPRVVRALAAAATRFHIA